MFSCSLQQIVLIKVFFLLVLYRPSEINSYRAWLYETFWIAVPRNREIPFNQVTFPTISRNRNHLLYKLHLKAAGFLDVLPSTPILWKAVLGQIGLFYSSAQNVWRSDLGLRAWEAEGNMVLHLLHYLPRVSKAVVGSSWLMSFLPPCRVWGERKLSVLSLPSAEGAQEMGWEDVCAQRVCYREAFPTPLSCGLLSVSLETDRCARMGMAHQSQQYSSTSTALQKCCRVLLLIPIEHNI